jgi:iron complex transport system permease protein
MASHAQPYSRSSTRILGSRALLLPGLAVGIGLLAAVVLVSITLGAADITPAVVYESLTAFDETSFDHLIIQTVRLPRVLAGVVVGAALAVAGAIMQGVTRNPLADSGILGINSGAAFAVVLAVYLIGAPSLGTYALAGFIGAGAAAVLVYALGSAGEGGATSFTTAILIFDQETLEQIRFWTAGSLAGRDMNLLLRTAPWMLAGLAGAMIISRQITTLSMGEDVAKGLGQNTGWVRLIAAGLVVLLAGGSVALAGPVGFVGLVVPHVVRFLVGVDFRWVLPYAAVLGAILVTLADIGARILIRPQELPVGVVMAFVGAPFFIALARWKVKR